MARELELNEPLLTIAAEPSISEGRFEYVGVGCWFEGAAYVGFKKEEASSWGSQEGRGAVVSRSGYWE